MIVTAVIGAVVIVFLLGVLKKWFGKSRIVNEVKSGVQSVQTFREQYPTPQAYEIHVIRELRIQGAEETLLKEVLKEAYDETIAQSHRTGEDPAHFVDRCPEALGFYRRCPALLFPAGTGIAGKRISSDACDTAVWRQTAVHTDRRIGIYPGNFASGSGRQTFQNIMI